MSPTNSALGVSDTTIKAMMDATIDAIESYLKVQFPFLSLPVVNEILHMILKELESMELTQIERVATFMIVDLQTGQEQSALASSASVLAAAQATGDKNAIDQATENFRKAFASLVHFDGS